MTIVDWYVAEYDDCLGVLTRKSSRMRQILGNVGSVPVLWSSEDDYRRNCIRVRVDRIRGAPPDLSWLAQYGSAYMDTESALDIECVWRISGSIERYGAFLSCPLRVLQHESIANFQGKPKLSECGQEGLHLLAPLAGELSRHRYTPGCRFKEIEDVLDQYKEDPPQVLKQVERRVIASELLQRILLLIRYLRGQAPVESLPDATEFRHEDTENVGALINQAKAFLEC